MGLFSALKASGAYEKVLLARGIDYRSLPVWVNTAICSFAAKQHELSGFGGTMDLIVTVQIAAEHAACCMLGPTQYRRSGGHNDFTDLSRIAGDWKSRGPEATYETMIVKTINDAGLLNAEYVRLFDPERRSEGFCGPQAQQAAAHYQYQPTPQSKRAPARSTSPDKFNKEVEAARAAQAAFHERLKASANARANDGTSLERAAQNQKSIQNSVRRSEERKETKHPLRVSGFIIFSILLACYIGLFRGFSRENNPPSPVVSVPARTPPRAVKVPALTSAIAYSQKKVATVPVSPQKPVRQAEVVSSLAATVHRKVCVVKPIMTDEEIQSCRNR